MFVRVTRPQMLRRLTKQMETFPVGGFLYSQTNMFRVDVTRSSCYFMLFVLGAVGFYHNNSNLLLPYSSMAFLGVLVYSLKMWILYVKNRQRVCYTCSYVHFIQLSDDSAPLLRLQESSHKMTFVWSKVFNVEYFTSSVAIIVPHQQSHMRTQLKYKWKSSQPWNVPMLKESLVYLI